MAAAAGFDDVLRAMGSTDNTIRAAAEAQYNAMKEEAVDMVMMALLSSMGANPDTACRSLAAVLLRQQVAKLKPEVLAALHAKNPGLAAALKTEPLRLLAAESIGLVRRKIAHVVAEVAVFAAGEGCAQWPELLQTVFTLTSSPDPSVRSDALDLFKCLASYDGEKMMGVHAPRLHAILSTLLADPNNKVRISAMTGLIAFIRCLKNAATRDAFQSLLTPMLKVLEAALSEDEEAARSAIMSLIDLVSEYPGFLKNHLEASAAAMLAVSTHADFDEETRSSALEFLVTIAESASTAVRKHPSLIQAIIAFTLNFLAGISFSADWQKKEEAWDNFLGSDDSDELPRAAAEALNRVALALGGKAVWPIVQAACVPMMRSADWRQRQAAIHCIGLVAEGCKKVIVPNIRELVTGVASLVSDPHVRVRYAVARALGQMAIDFTDPYGTEADEVVTAKKDAVAAGKAGTAARGAARETLKSIQDAASGVFLPAIIKLLWENAEAPRVRSVAGSALANFVAGCSAGNLTGHTRPLLEALIMVLGEASDFVAPKETAMAAVGSIAYIIEAEFGDYYAHFMPIAKRLVAELADKGTKFIGVRGKAFECISLICEGVGVEVCAADAEEVLHVMVREMEAMAVQIAAADAGAAAPAGVEAVKIEPESYRFLTEATVRIARMLGPRFAPYLAPILPPLLHVASMNVKLYLDENDAAKEATKEKDNLTVGGGRMLTLDAESYLMKGVALSCLSELTEALGVDLPPFWAIFDQVADLFIKEMEDVFAELRGQAVAGMTHLLRSALADVTKPAKAQAFFEAALPVLMDTIKRESDLDTLYGMASVLCEFMELAHDSTTAPGGVATPQPAPTLFGAEPTGPTPHTVIGIPTEKIQGYFEALKDLMERTMRRRASMIEQWDPSLEHDAEDEEAFFERLEPERDTATAYTDSVGYIIKITKQACLPAIAATVGPFLMPYLGNTDRFMRPFRHSAICLCDDLIEHASPAAHSILDAFLPHMFAAAQDPDSIIRQAAVYGIGVCVEFATERFKAHVPTALPILGKLLTAPDARDEDNENVTDNAVSAMLRIARRMGGVPGVDPNAIMPGVLGYFPLKADHIEARLVHGWFVDALASLDPLWLGEGNVRLPQAIIALARSLLQHKLNLEEADKAAALAAEEGDDDGEDDDGAEDLFSEESLAKLRGVLGGMRANPAAWAFLAPIVGSLKKKQQAVLVEYGMGSL